MSDTTLEEFYMTLNNYKELEYILIENGMHRSFIYGLVCDALSDTYNDILYEIY